MIIVIVKLIVTSWKVFALDLGCTCIYWIEYLQ